MRSMSVGAAAVALQPSRVFGQTRTSGKPNVVLLFIDDLGYGDLGCFGSKTIPTPHMDSLAREGVRLTMHYITNPPCSPSRASLMMGMYGQRFGKYGMDRGQPLPEDEPTLAEFMRDAGYVTGQIGKWDMGDATQSPDKRGFMEVARYNGGQSYICEKPGGGTTYRTIQDGDYMVEFVERNKNRPFFLYFSPLAIHSPHNDVPEEYANRGGGSKYGGAVVAVDEAVGKLRAVLKKHRLEENTLIILTGDNGPGRGGSSAPYTGDKSVAGIQREGYSHVPGIAWWPGTIPAGTILSGLSCTLDYYATAAAVAGKNPPKNCDGKNLLPYLTGEKTGDVHEYLYWYILDPEDTRLNLSVMRWKNWRLIKAKNTRKTKNGRNTGKPGKWLLFDIVNDPMEKVDLASKHPDVVENLRLKHEQFVASLPSRTSFPEYKTIWATPPEGVGWVIGDGK